MRHRSRQQHILLRLLVLLFAFSTSTAVENKQEEEDSILLESIGASDQRSARAIFTGSDQQRILHAGGNRKGARPSPISDGGRKSCRATVTTLAPGQATIVKSHGAYGIDPYPENYLCRWLFLPTENCQMGLECDVGTRRNLRRSRFEKCSGADADYLRILGDRGHVDAYYCGNNGPNTTFSPGNAVALLFRSNTRQSDDSGDARLGLGLEGFSCKIVCKDTRRSSTPVPPVDSTTKTTTTRSPGAPSPAVPCQCGEVREARIVCPQGLNCTAPAASVPWQAALVHRGGVQPWCGGSLINSRYVLTAAHCLKGKRANRVQVILGEHDWTALRDAQHERYSVVELIRHERFAKLAQFDYDFALLKLDRPVFMGRQHVRPICLPEEAIRLVGKSGVASGWGVTDPSKPKQQAKALQRVSVDVISLRACRDKYPVNPVTKNMFCAQSETADACFGDSGGPFVMRNDHTGLWELQGVISWGKSCATRKWPGVYARVSSVLDWIRENTQDAHYCQRDTLPSRGRVKFYY